MLDYIKIKVSDIDVEKLLYSPDLDFNGKFSTLTGVCSDDSFIATYHFCTITVDFFTDRKGIRKSVVHFLGSIHKMWNSLNGVYAPNHNTKRQSGFNGNQFGLNSIIEMRKHLQKLFDCNPAQMIFENIELGVNAIVPFAPKKFIKGLLSYSCVPFEFSFNRNYAQANLQRYYVKIYNKSLQYSLPEHIVRLEIKVKKMEDLKITGIKSFADINASTILKAQNLLLKRLQDIVYYDTTINKKSLSKHDLQKLSDYSNVNFWIEKDSNRLDRPKKWLQSMIDLHSDNLKQQVIESVQEICVRFNQAIEAGECVRFNHLNIGLSITQNNSTKRRSCPVTGLDISMQKDNSNLLSHSGLKFYAAKQPNVFNRLERQYLTATWRGFDFEIQIREMAHNIRDRYRHRQERQFKFYPACQPSLFELPSVTIKTVD